MVANRRRSARSSDRMAARETWTVGKLTNCLCILPRSYIIFISDHDIIKNNKKNAFTTS